LLQVPVYSSAVKSHPARYRYSMSEFVSRNQNGSLAGVILYSTVILVSWPEGHSLIPLNICSCHSCTNAKRRFGPNLTPLACLPYCRNTSIFLSQRSYQCAVLGRGCLSMAFRLSIERMGDATEGVPRSWVFRPVRTKNQTQGKSRAFSHDLGQNQRDV
jgi:hypothetical protein